MLKKPLIHFAVTTCLTLGSALLAHAEATSGTILETMNSAGYTYILVDSGTAKQWVAIPETSVSKGDKVAYIDGMVMENFHSKSLDKTFPSVIFSEGLAEGGNSAAAVAQAPPAEDSFAAAVAKEQQAVASPHGQAAPVAMEASGGSAGAVVPFSDLEIEKAAGENSYTVAEVFEQAKDLNGKEIRIRGQVVKFSPNIMGRHWIHIQDGTGDPMKNSHDLVLTSAETVAKGEVVVLIGTLAADKDFGAGYKYDAIVEKAVVER